MTQIDAPLRKESCTGWRRWVPPEVHSEIVGFMRRAFTGGCLFAAVSGTLYWHHSVSKEKLFQFLILIGATAFTIPALMTSLRMMLLMAYMGWNGQDKSEGMFKAITELKDEVKPILENVGKIVENLNQVVERHGGKAISTSLIEEAKDFLAKEGILQRLDRLTKAIEALGSSTIGAPRKSGLLEKGIAKARLAEAEPAEALNPAAIADEETRVLGTDLVQRSGTNGTPRT